MTPEILRAIADGEAVLAAKKAEEQAKHDAELAARVTAQALAQADAVVWARDVLPGRIREETANGRRQLNVGAYWVERSMDEGQDGGSYTQYTVHW